jgi:hypothetical protein
VYGIEKKIVACGVLSDLLCEENRIWRKNLKSLLPRKEQGRYLKYCLNALNVVCLCALLYVLFQCRLEQLDISLLRAHGPLNVIGTGSTAFKHLEWVTHSTQ